MRGLYREFVAEAAVDAGFDGSLRFVVVGDGRELWTSEPVSKAGAPLQVRVNIAGVKRLVLRATAVGEAQAGSRGARGEAQVPEGKAAGSVPA